MHKLRRENFASATRFLRRAARPLDWALFKFHFNSSITNTEVAEILASYQNADGGFGNALEPDLRMPQSSAVATAIALRLMVECGIHSGDLLTNTLRYLNATLEPGTLYWLIAPQEGRREHPHAPWWGGDDIVKDFGGCLANPRAQIVGSLLALGASAEFDQELLAQLLKSCLAHLASLPEKMEMHDLICYLQLANSPGLPESLRTEITPKLRQAVFAVVSQNPAEWTGYAVKPLMLCPEPNALFAADLRDSLSANLDFEISRQESSGTWEPAWSWSDYNQEGWLEARRDWRGFLTFETLLTLKRFSRLE